MASDQAGRIDNGSLDALFREARTHHVWLHRPVPNDLLQELYELTKMGPTSAWCMIDGLIACIMTNRA